MIKQKKPVTLFSLLLLITISCSAQDRSPTDQVIRGPVDITTEWQTITFDKPLQSAPYIQYLELLSCHNEYDFVEVGPPDEKKYILMSDRFRRVSDQQIVEPEVIVNDGKHDYRLFYSVTGYDYAGPAKGCKYVGYSLRGEGVMELTLPKDVKFVSIKIRANVPMSIDHLYWLASGYNRYPNEKWSGLHSSEIINMESQILSPDD